HVKLDEFALHKDQRTLYAVAKPVIQWGGTLSVISTHRGAGTVFNELIGDIRQRGNRMGWSLHTIPIQTAVEQGLVEKINAATGGSNRPFAEHEEQLYQLLRMRQLRRACLDATGMGIQLAERARERFEWKVEPITFTVQTKEALATGLKMDLENRHLRLVDDP